MKPERKTSQMGYTLIIGEFEPAFNYDGLESYISNDVRAEKLDNAPAYGEPTDYTNGRWPSYSSWAAAMRFTGLYDIMFNESTGLIREHPGCFPLVKEHKEIIDKAYAEYYSKYPNCKAGYSPKLNEEKRIFEDPDWPICNNHATRLEWLKFWVDWALTNCKRPVFYNS